ncbi:hypothetical protein CCR75_009439 [Bremia lactucae]|uniref:Uncharacterized protein n=1 Tax=Bremia lactucae TaxID=4779 RepID=A0A976IJI1_BRELC|nr:hypothetical protein CCR75_009439 [Bremia lactucae]
MSKRAACSYVAASRLHLRWEYLATTRTAVQAKANCLQATCSFAAAGDNAIILNMLAGAADAGQFRTLSC